jgi:hypothetical protein
MAMRNWFGVILNRILSRTTTTDRAVGINHLPPFALVETAETSMSSSS